MITINKINKALDETKGCLYLGGKYTGKVMDVCDNLIFMENIKGFPFYLHVSEITDDMKFMDGKTGQECII